MSVSNNINYPDTKIKIPEKYEKELKKTYKPENSNLTKIIKEFFQSIFTDIKQNWKAHLGAEHMSKGALAEGDYTRGIDKTLKILKNIENPSVEIKNVIKALDFAQKISSSSNHKNIGADAQFIQESIKKLEPGQSLAVPSNVKGHAMILMIT